MARIKLYAILPWIIQRGVWVPCRLFFIIFFNLEVKGTNNLIEFKDSKLIIASNHVSQFDPVLIPSSIPFFSSLLPVFNISRDKTFYSDSLFQKFFYGGLLFKILGSYSVKVGLNNYNISLFRHIQILNDNHTVVIFPEGGISTTGEINKVKNGLGYLAYTSKSFVIPVKIKGIHGTTFTDIFLRRRKVSVNFGKPVNINKKEFRDVNDLEIYRKITSIVINEIKQL